MATIDPLIIYIIGLAFIMAILAFTPYAGATGNDLLALKRISP